MKPGDPKEKGEDEVREEIVWVLAAMVGIPLTFATHYLEGIPELILSIIAVSLMLTYSTLWLVGFVRYIRCSSTHP